MGGFFLKKRGVVKCRLKPDRDSWYKRRPEARNDSPFLASKVELRVKKLQSSEKGRHQGRLLCSSSLVSYFHASALKSFPRAEVSSSASSITLLSLRHLGKRPVNPVRLDRGTIHILLVHVSEHKFQVLAVALGITYG